MSAVTITTAIFLEEIVVAGTESVVHLGQQQRIDEGLRSARQNISECQWL